MKETEKIVLRISWPLSVVMWMRVAWITWGLSMALSYASVVSVQLIGWVEAGILLRLAQWLAEGEWGNTTG